MSLFETTFRDSSPASEPKGSPELADFRSRRLNNKIRQTTQSPTKYPAAVDGIFDRLQCLLVDWNHKKTSDRREGSSVERTLLQPTSQSSLGASFELKNLKALKKRGRVPTDTLPSLNNDTLEPNKMLGSLREESHEMSKVMTRDDYSNNGDEEGLERDLLDSMESPRENVRSSGSFLITQLRSKLRASAPTSKLKPMLRINTNTSEDSPQRIQDDLIRPSTTTAADNKNTELMESLTRKRNNTVREQSQAPTSIADLDSRLRMNVQKQLRAESKKVKPRIETSGSPGVTSPILKTRISSKFSGRYSPSKSPSTTKLTIDQASIPAVPEKKVTKTVKKAKVASSTTDTIRSGQSSIVERTPRTVTSKKNTENSATTPLRSRKSDTIDHLIANVSVLRKGEKKVKPATASTSTSSRIKNKGSFIESTSTRLPTEKEESMTKDQEPIEIPGEKRLKERPKTSKQTGSSTTAGLRSGTTGKVDKVKGFRDLSESIDSQKLPDNNCVTDRTSSSHPDRKLKGICDRSESLDSQKLFHNCATDRTSGSRPDCAKITKPASRSSSISAQKEESSPAPKSKKKPILGKVKSKIQRTKTIESTASIEEKPASPLKRLVKSKTSVKDEKKPSDDTESDSALSRPNPEPHRLLVLPASPPHKSFLKEKNDEAAPRPATSTATTKAKKPKEVEQSSFTANLCRQYGSENIAAVLNKLNGKYSELPKRERVPIKNQTTSTGSLNSPLLKYKSYLNEGSHKTILDYSLKNDAVLRASNDLFDKESPKKKKDSSVCEEINSPKTNELGTPRSGFTGKASPSSNISSKGANKSPISSSASIFKRDAKGAKQFSFVIPGKK